MGWGLATAWRQGRYARLGLTYLGAVSIHGLWNGITLFSSFVALAESQQLPLNIPGIAELGEIAPIGLFVLAGATFVALVWANWRLARSVQAEAVAGSRPAINGENLDDENLEESVL
jgi:hypothetical protein